MKRSISFVTLFRSITMLCGTDNSFRNIFEYSPHSFIKNVVDIQEYSKKYCQSHITILWTWIMLCYFFTNKFVQESLKVIRIGWMCMYLDESWHCHPHAALRETKKSNHVTTYKNKILWALSNPRTSRV